MHGTIRLADESVVSFAVRDGRVEHRDLAFGLPDLGAEFVVRTQGTVGMDGTDGHGWIGGCVRLRWRPKDSAFIRDIRLVRVPHFDLSTQGARGGLRVGHRSNSPPALRSAIASISN